MEEKIDQILLANFKEGDWQDARKQLLLLFSVSGQSELLRAYFKWHKEQGYVSHKDSDIDEFIASNCH